MNTQFSNTSASTPISGNLSSVATNLHPTSVTHPRERLVRTAAALVHRQGWTITGINQILTEAGIPKGSFYYYFRSKEALGVAVLQHHYGNLKTFLERTLLNESLSLDDALHAFFVEVTTGPLAAEYKYGCPVGNLANEIATQCPALLAEASRALDLYRDSFTALARRGQKEGFPSNFDSHAFGRIATMLVQGAFLASKSDGTTEALSLAHNAISKLAFGKEASNVALNTAHQNFAGQSALAS